MVRFFLGDVEVFFPYDYVYPEQYEYMRLLKQTLTAKGHCVLEMPTGTGKTVALLSLITSYKMAHPETGKLIYCTRTIPEMEKALKELQTVIEYQQKELEGSENTILTQSATTMSSESSLFPKSKSSRRFLGLGMTSRRNLCIHPVIASEANRDKVDEMCQQLTASWIRRKRLIDSKFIKSKADAEQMDNNSSHISDLEDIHTNFQSENSCSKCNHDTVSKNGTHVCEYYENLDMLWSPSLFPSGVYTINDMKKLGARWRHPENPDKKAPFCPYFASRRLLQVADVIILSYQYILDPKVSQVAFMGKIGPAGILDSKVVNKSNVTSFKDPSIVVFDEAHNIDNVCIEAFSINMNMITLERARQNILKLEKEVERTKFANADRLLNEYQLLVTNLRDIGQLDDLAVETLANPVLPEDVVKEAVPGNIRRAEFFLATMKRLVSFLTSYIKVFTVKTEGPLTCLKRIKDDTALDTKTLKFCYERLKSLLNTLEITTLEEFAPLTLVSNFFTLLGTYWEGFIIITDPYPEAEGIYEPLIQLSCLDSSLAMRPVLQKFQSVILTSGTISPLFLYPKILGFQPVITQSLPMSLDRECIKPLIVAKGSDQVPLTSRFDLRSDQAVLRNFGTLLIELSKTVPDGMVCFFTSYSFMEHIVAEWYQMGVLAEVMQYKLILMETKDVVATTLALHCYRKACDSGRGAVFFSVARGKVAEGIDFDRHYGRAVVLFGIPYQYTLSRILKARLDFMRETYQVPENEFLTFDAMRQAAQCVGRIIRSKADYGLMIFADCRYSRLDKRQKLPDWILRHLEPSHMTLSTEAALCLAKRFLIDMSQPLNITRKSRLDLTDLQRLQKRYESEATLVMPTISTSNNNDRDTTMF